MPDWSASMQRTYEYYIVDPKTWKDTKLLDNVKTSSIQRDLDADTLGSATIDVIESLGECYIRIYLVTIQNGIRERFPLGTFLVQTPSSDFDGKVRSVTMDAYTPLIELKENQPPIGYFIPKDENIMDWVGRLSKENMRAPVISASSDEIMYYDFVTNVDETWLSFIASLAENAKYSFSLDEMGRVLFAPKQKIESLQPVWTYDDSDDSILYSEITVDHDLYDVPNVVEVVYSTNSGSHYARVVNDDPNSPTSIQNRGREITKRVTDPSLVGDNPTNSQIDAYAKQLLEELSTVEYTVSYSHGYCPVRLGDCVRLNYSRAGLVDIKAKVISQSINCDASCQVQEKATFTSKLWEG